MYMDVKVKGKPIDEERGESYQGKQMCGVVRINRVELGAMIGTAATTNLVEANLVPHLSL